MNESVEPRSPALLKTLIERLVEAGVSPMGPVMALQLDALTKLLVDKGVVTVAEWDNAAAERIEHSLSRMPEQPKIVTVH